MDSTLTLIITLISALIPSISSDTTAIGKIITALEQLLPAIIAEVKSLVPIVQNIISALSNSSGVTPDQLTSLAALDAQCDAAFEAAATTEGDPAPPATPAPSAS